MVSVTAPCKVDEIQSTATFVPTGWADGTSVLSDRLQGRRTVVSDFQQDELLVERFTPRVSI